MLAVRHQRAPIVARTRPCARRGRRARRAPPAGAHRGQNTPVRPSRSPCSPCATSGRPSWPEHARAPVEVAVLAVRHQRAPIVARTRPCARRGRRARRAPPAGAHRGQNTPVRPSRSPCSPCATSGRPSWPEHARAPVEVAVLAVRHQRAPIVARTRPCARRGRRARRAPPAGAHRGQNTPVRPSRSPCSPCATSGRPSWPEHARFNGFHQLARRPASPAETSETGRPTGEKGPNGLRRPEMADLRHGQGAGATCSAPSTACRRRCSACPWQRQGCADLGFALEGLNPGESWDLERVDPGEIRAQI